MTKQKAVDFSLEFFVEQLVEEKGLGSLDPEVLEQLKKDLLKRLEDRVNASAVAAMPLDKLDEMKKVVEGGKEGEIQKFCSQNIENFDEVIAKELLSFRQTYLAK